MELKRSFSEHYGNLQTVHAALGETMNFKVKGFHCFHSITDEVKDASNVFG